MENYEFLVDLELTYILFVYSSNLRENFREKERLIRKSSFRFNRLDLLYLGAILLERAICASRRKVWIVQSGVLCE